jgi:hypothetical protein
MSKVVPYFDFKVSRSTSNDGLMADSHDDLKTVAVYFRKEWETTMIQGEEDFHYIEFYQVD